MRPWTRVMLGLVFIIASAIPCLGYAGPHARASQPISDLKLPYPPMISGKRVALVVGNSDYINIPKISNPRNDADDVGAALNDLGFDVVVAKNLTKKQFQDALSRFRIKAYGADIGIIFYAGQGIEYDHEDYLIPVDALIKQPELLNIQSVKIDELRSALEEVGGAKVIIFDACRYNPFKNSTKAAETDVSTVTDPAERPPRSNNLAIVFSTQAGISASDGIGRNSPFSEALINQLRQDKSQELTAMLMHVVRDVQYNTSGIQKPELITSIHQDHWIGNLKDRSEWEAITEWESVKQTRDPKILRTFAARFPDSTLRPRAESLADQFEHEEAQRQKEALQKSCADDAAKLKALWTTTESDRLVDIQRFAASSATCDTVRDEATKLVASLRIEEAKASRDAAQAKICAAEVITLKGLMSHGARASVEAFGRIRQCKTLDVSAAVAQLDDLAHEQQTADLEGILKPNLYALVIGVTHYADGSLDLMYPAQDAIGLAAVLKGQEGRLYRHVEVRVLTDKDATVSGVRDGLLWLRRQTTNHDLAVVFAAGHGTTDRKGHFWFATQEVDPVRLYSTAISNDELEESLFSLPGKKILLLDACHSGAALEDHSRGLERVDMSAVMNDFAQAEGGMVTYAASTSRELSFERPEWGHGAFTKALIEGLGGRADLMHRGTVTTATLDAYVEDRVKELTGGQQHPVMTRPRTVPDFPIAAVQ